MITVNQLLHTKGTEVWCVAPDDTVLTALQRMADKNIGAVLVTDNDALVGIVSERDYARKIVLQQRASHDTLVRDIMTANVVCVRPQQTLQKCLALMTEKRIRHLPVLDDANQLVGLISIGDVVKEIIKEQQILINHLEDYITGVAR